MMMIPFFSPLIRSRRAGLALRNYSINLQHSSPEAAKAENIYTAASSSSRKRDVETPHSFDDLQVHLGTLPNNLSVAACGGLAPSVGFIWKIPAGSRYEDSKSAGLSHYLRHAFFAVSLLPLISH